MFRAPRGLVGALPVLLDRMEHRRSEQAREGRPGALRSLLGELLDVPEVLRELLRAHGDGRGGGLRARLGGREASPEVPEPRFLPAKLCDERFGLADRGERDLDLGKAFKAIQKKVEAGEPIVQVPQLPPDYARVREFKRELRARIVALMERLAEDETDAGR